MKALESLKLADFEAYVPQMLASINIDVHTYGNLSKQVSFYSASKSCSPFTKKYTFQCLLIASAKPLLNTLMFK